MSLTSTNIDTTNNASSSSWTEEELSFQSLWHTSTLRPTSPNQSFAMLGAILDDIIKEQESFQTVTESLQKKSHDSYSDSMTILTRTCNYTTEAYSDAREQQEATSTSTSTTASTTTIRATHQEERERQVEQAQRCWAQCAQSFLYLYMKVNE
jgi:hypothetical protein